MKVSLTIIDSAFFGAPAPTIGDEFLKRGFPFKTKILKAQVQDRFFVRIIGRGYPPRMVKKLRLLKGGSVPTFLVLDRCCTTSLPWTLE
jgi:hypothetical protein